MVPTPFPPYSPRLYFGADPGALSFLRCGDEGAETMCIVGAKGASDGSASVGAGVRRADGNDAGWGAWLAGDAEGEFV